MDLGRLPEAEFEIMEFIWQQQPPVTSAMVMEGVGREKGWKAQTLLTLLSRLCTRGFLTGEKKLGREKAFTPLVDRQTYLQSETRAFARQIHAGSPASLLTAWADEQLTDQEIDELESLIKTMRERRK